MSGLSLIGEYSSDTEDEKSSPEKVEKHKNRFERKLPVPESIIKWKGVDHHREVEDDPTQHEGRVRSFKHERGNWATLVYVLYKPTENLRLWMDCVKSQLSLEDGKLFEEFHISLTRTVTLKFHWIDSFVEGLKKVCGNSDHFTMELTDVKVYCNDERTRTFLGIRCESNNRALESLTDSLNKLLSEYRLPCFYEEASHHISFLWSLGDQEKKVRAHLPFLSSSLKNFLLKNPEENFVQVDELHCKIGNRLYTFHLR